LKQFEENNIFVPSSVYWQERAAINLPYLPYFSNCKGYGQYIPIWGITEQNYECVLVEVNSTVYMSEYSFRQAPKADSCFEVVVECVYDEVWSDDQESLTRWFEVDAETALFDFSINPISASEIEGAEFSENDVLSVAPQGGAGGLNTAPQSVALSIQFYQYSKRDKRLIAIDISFGKL